MLLILTWFGQDFPAGQVVCPQLPYRCNDMIFWIFPIVPCHAFCMWHWPIGKDLDLSFIWGHHHLSEYRDISRQAEYFIACYTVLTRPNKVETAVHGCRFVGFHVAIVRFSVYHVVAPLSFSRSISLASLFAILSIFGWSDLLQILRFQAAFSFAVLCIIVFYCPGWGRLLFLHGGMGRSHIVPCARYVPMLISVS